MASPRASLLAVSSLIVFLCCIAPVYGEYFKYSALLSGAQAVPPVATPGEGAGAFTFNTDDRKLRYDIQWAGLTKITAAHLHGPALPGSNAGILHQFETSSDITRLSGSLKLTSTQAEYLRQGMLYVVIHTEANQAGELRGQLLPSSNEFTANLKGSHIRPNAVDTSASGSGVFTFNPETRQLSWEIEHDIDRPTAAHIHGPANTNANANVLIPFQSAFSPIKGKRVLTELEIQYLKTGLLYVAIHSQKHANGEIRGQILLEPSSSGIETFTTTLVVGLALSGSALLIVAVLAGFAIVQYQKRNTFLST